MISLSKLAVGSSAVVREFPKGGSAFLRLREMGILPGTSLKLLAIAPLGDPMEVVVRGYRLTLRRTEADAILVEPSGQ